MVLTLSIPERLTRARADLRMGVPVVLCGAEGAALVAAVETLDAARLADLRGFGVPVLAITARRAETLKARAYDGDLARIVPPAETGLDWLRAVADPADDLRTPIAPMMTPMGAVSTPAPGAGSKNGRTTSSGVNRHSSSRPCGIAKSS